MGLIFAVGAAIFGILNYLMQYAGGSWIPFFIVMPFAITIFIFGSHFRVYRFSPDGQFVVGTKRYSNGMVFIFTGHFSFLWPIFSTLIVILGKYASASAQLLIIPLVIESMFFSYFLPIQLLPKKFWVKNFMRTHTHKHSVSQSVSVSQSLSQSDSVSHTRESTYVSTRVFERERQKWKLW